MKLGKMNVFRGALGLAALLPCALSAADFVSTGTVRYVDNQLGSDETGDGTEEHPYASINKAVSLMAKEDIVRIRPGKVYVLDAPITNDYAAFHVGNTQYAHITIEGTDPDNRVVISGDGRHQGFALYGMGTLMRNLCISNCTVEATGQGAAVHFLDGTGWGGLAEMWRLGARFDNCAFVACTNTTADTDNSKTPGAIYVNKCAFYDCEFIANQGAGAGGAVYCEVVGSSNGGKCFSNCVFRANSAWDYGGAVYVHTASATTAIFGDCLFESNSVRKAVKAGDCTGGAFYGISSEIGGCTFRGNYAYGGGGAIYSRGMALAIHDCVFDGNSSDGDNWYPGGGAIYCWSGGTVSGCTFTSNSLAKSNGGALLIAAEKSAQPISVSGCIFDGNSTGGSGGAIFVKSGSTSLTGVIDRVTFTGNTATGTGGGFYSEAGSNRLVVVRNSLFAKNSANNGGGAASVHWDQLIRTSLENCTFADNTATSAGGGLYAKYSAVGVTNCLFYGNMQGATANAISVASSATVETDHCLEESVDPLFKAPARGDYSLKSQSPARNAGANLPWMAGAFDLEGNARVNPDDMDGGVAFSDIGCYEWFSKAAGLILSFR